MELYQEYILDLYKHPLNKIILSTFNVQHKEHNPLCGDVVELSITFDKQNKVSNIGWQGDGCAISQASTSLLTDHIKSKSKKELAKITNDEVLDLLGLKNLNPTRQRCATLALEALKKMI